MRLIDADAAEELIDHMLNEGNLNMRNPDAVRYNVRLMLTEEYYTPTIDPVKHGRWIENGYGNGEIVCSNCGEPCATFSNLKPRDRYCKWCGARMRGDEDE